MTRSKRSRRGVAESTVVVEATPQISFCRVALASFLSAAAATVGANPTHCLLRTNGWKSLAALTCLPPLDYATVLLLCNLVKVRQLADGSNEVLVLPREWERFLGEYAGLGGNTEREGGTSNKLTKAPLYPDALERKTDGGDIERDWKNMTPPMYFFRVGRVSKNANMVLGQQEINMCIEPPKLNRRTYKAAHNLTETLGEVIMEYQMEEDTLSLARAVRDWVLLIGSKPTVSPQVPTEETPTSAPSLPTEETPTSAPSPPLPTNDESPLSNPPSTEPPTKPPCTTAETHQLHEEQPKKRQDLKATPKEMRPPPTTKKWSTFEALDIPDSVRQQLPMISSFTPDSYNSWDSQKQKLFLDELTLLKKRFEMEDISPEVRKQFPSLAAFMPNSLNRGKTIVNGIDMDKNAMDAALREIVKYNANENQPLRYKHGNGHEMHLIHLPISRQKDGSLVPGIDRCMTEFFRVLDEKFDESTVVDGLLDYLLAKHEDVLKHKLREHRLIPKVMDEYDTACLLDESGIKIWQWCSVQQCLKLFMDIQQVSVAEKFVRALGQDHGEIKHGTYHYTDPKKPGKTKEEIRYWTKDPVFEFMQSIEGMINGYDLDPLHIKFINIVHGGDHGKENFRFASKVVIGMKDGKFYDDIFGLADVKCKKDNATVLDNTCMPALNTGINIINKSDIVFSHDENGKLSMDLVESTKHASSQSIHPNSYIAGDLVFLAIMLGKEGFGSAWCNWCRLKKSEFSDCSAELVHWTLKLLREQAELNTKKGFDDERRCGVKSCPECEVEPENYLFSGLHAMMGVIMQVLAKLELFVDLSIEQITHEELQLRRHQTSLASLVACAKSEKSVWMDSCEGGRLLLKKERRVKRINVLLTRKATDDEAKASLSKEKQGPGVEIKELCKVRGKHSKKIEDLEKEETKVKDKLKEYRKDRRGEETSIYTQVDRFFKQVGANRAAYHGGTFTGVDLRKIIKNADKLFGKGGIIRNFLRGKCPDEDVKLETNSLCDDVCLSLKVWDDVFARINQSDDGSRDWNAFCDETQKKIDNAMALHRRMGLSVTPKAHGMERHVVPQMRRVPGGLGKLMENWVEHYHQVGYRFDVSYGRAGSLANQADIHSRMEKRARHPRVRMNKKLVEERYKGSRKKKESALKKESMEELIKIEMRDAASEEVAVKLEDLDAIDELERRLRNWK